MIKLFKRIFGSTDVLKETITVVKDAGDAMWYTDEEKATDRLRRAEQVDKVLIDWMDSTKGQNLSRRFIAMLVSFLWVFLFIVSWVFEITSVWNELSTEALADTSAITQKYLEQSTGAMMLVLGFYFAATYMKDVVSTALSKFSGDKKNN